MLATETLVEQRVSSRVKLADCEKILVVKLDRLGDFILATPFLRGLRKSAPYARIDLIVTAEAYALAELCPFVNRVIEFTSTSLGYGFRTANSQVGEEFYADFRAADFDLALIPRWDYDFWQATAFAKAAKARNIVAFAKPERYNLEDYGELCTEVLHRPFVAHEAEHTLALLDFVGGTRAGSETEVWISREDQRAADIKRSRAVGDHPFLAVFLGANQFRRILPAEQLRVILSRFSAEYPEIRYLLLGGKCDDDAAQTVIAGLPQAVSLCGQTSVREAVALAGTALAAVTMDSAPAHFAAAVATPLVVFCCHPMNGDPGDVHSPARFGPRGSAKCVILQPSQALPPCQDRCRGETAHCIVNISEEAAVKAISQVVQAGLALSSPEKSCLT